MNILITGGCGFLGARLARTLLAGGNLALAGGAAQPVSRITLADRVPPPADLAADARVQFVQGDLLEQLASGALPIADTQLVFHLAAAVSGECEADFDLGMRSNLDATRGLLEAARRAGHAPVFVFSSSVAVFGDSPEQRLPAVIEDTTLPTPQNSYGIQKFIGEQLVADFTRKGFVQGRNVRLMTVSVRPGKPNGAASSFLSGMLREPLAGERARCPVSPETPVALASPGNTVAGIVRAATAGAAEWGARTAINLPALTTTVREMAQALERIAGKDATALIDWAPDAAVAKIVTSWPSRIHAARAEALGLKADASFDAILRDYVRENVQAVKLPIAKD
ncbi:MULTISPECIES: D-erythronate dehydrogenase [Variovorax]|jgi:D-erythronate 2-dehydrogenase|uniref:D-erythronate dehydrogenase n=1 Tax=Variovorax TaxID=34072 RepID=UPI00086E1566|nr:MULTISPECIES: D-erythronate dehydrogenase [Variovorax]MBN8755113.1 NAD-dependent epimerase/dehydratase family protein [Variovorax sp.]ODU14920.1 MAG: NAD-dependent epimerase [Variovorax sp. SCN 67-85]ODV26254.1 MAG: NAD-dependent epimerase [Variovorax sp. SCN 67-20]OJZ03764.1 MAG: NAD-dependent epimerase [Variovorax sp. 67-131]UKI07471.1 NAD-dependent epimerase/dehydratase family protein [Variovorax paradoxus]